ncbi:NAD(P)/FAD-dependent oxidoreductase [Sphingomonas sp. Leaf25]|uniref:NAD(P)/FAD-dependent oxidoreductase n=1 Tax=Sphingomonas sp. Leaf25 TaxID=1735692 RepID=UPI0006F4697B|nr:NAD(P)/FAD-dependent oxidoreductase [Sphingomonas sp. Leaf25]KQM98791.1 pyridine nucleotide-disulfide oxidoreductase [Sphingomonas sp. Leaf25]
MPERIVIVGAGFGGIAAAQALRHADAQVTLIDRTNHHLFQPLLYQVAGAALSPADIATANRALLRRNRNTRVLMAEVAGVDAAAKQVRLNDGRRLPFDRLILATGAAYSFFGHDDWAEHAFVLKSIDDALAIRAAVLGAFERAEQCDDPAELRRLLTFAVVGGGPTGVELAGTIAELARTTLARDFAHVDPRGARVVLCEMGDRILAGFDPALSASARRALESLGVEVRTGAAVETIDDGGLTVGGERIDAAAVLWAAGTAARPVARWLGTDAARNGAVKVRPDCSVPGHPDIFAIGDVASFEGDKGPLPGLAPVAKQQGKYVGRLIAGRIAGTPDPGPFRYRDYGSMAVIGRSRAVAEIGGMKLKGFVAWLAWSLVHLMLLVDFRSRVAVYVNWSWSWFTYGRGARLLTGYAPDPGERPKPPVLEG